MTSATIQLDTATIPRADLTSPTVVTATINAERDRLARLTARGIGMPLAGMLYWITVAMLVRSMPLKMALFWSFVATGAVFPVGTLFTRWFGGNLFAKSETFTSLGLLFNAMQFLYWPIVILVWKVSPEWTLYAMATLFGTHFLGYAWLYRSRGYGVLTVGICVVLTAAVLIAGDPLLTTIPVLAALVYAVSVIVLFGEVRRDRALNTL